MLKIAITGSTGLVGSRIQELLYHDFIFLPLLQSKIDITDQKSVEDFCAQNDFDLMLHLAAYTPVDQAEKDKDLATKINKIGTQNLFNAVYKKKKKFVYISTDFVFDGEHPPYYEDSKPNPKGVYGKTKYEGEKIVGSDGMIVRISYPYRAEFEKKEDLVRSIQSYLEEGKALRMIGDTQITPTFIDDIAFALKHLLTNYSPEIYHIVGSQSLSPYEVGLKISDVYGLDKTLIKKTTYDEFYKDNDIRPKQSVIKSRKNTFWEMKSFDEGLKELKKQASR